ncbi:hypothetical protein SARC_13392 [Sphaeroforma arctica JP610]|uniref:IBR domain-containing protein n=1 Tax=Sphaeroforma arctica JP610 TaxID=667725 RepID=A0A0L0FBB8_9EUKA|nr:hypothetical protein SARC_13392 [Sphaeroforma arctica JP610]KNC74050.1 hypothetical protein SARC_13392 [Sphaeroforma arctica JP610]|eukprot:XP_014147952.1 hypothetical protein SARC_13392 [Sphaeroforma arctica JP610]
MCAQVNCPHCGGEFCWRCLNTWTKGSCGYFSCAINGDNEMDIDDAVSLATATTKSEDKPSLRVVTSSTDAVKLGVNDSPILAKAELGVPDIATIRFGSRGHQTGDGR